MRLYEYITQPDKLDVIVKLIRTGIIPDSMIVTHIRIYEDYLLHPSPIKKVRNEYLAEKYRMSPKTIERIILKLKKQIK